MAFSKVKGEKIISCDGDGCSEKINCGTAHMNTAYVYLLGLGWTRGWRGTHYCRWHKYLANTA